MKIVFNKAQEAQLNISWA